tara:strand:- start:328 stop:579 length:252 start_codon:yes stop_codon:yes gene_type:complete
MVQRSKLLAIACEKCGSKSRLYSTGSAASYIGVSEGTVIAYTESRQLPKRLAKGFVFTEGELQHAMERLNLDRAEIGVTRVTK